MPAPPTVTFTSEHPVLGLVNRSVVITFNIENALPRVRPENIKWIFQNNRVTDAVILEENTRYNFSVNHQSLTISGVAHTDEGDYIVHAMNEVGSDTLTITLEVEGGLNLLRFSVGYSIM